MHPIVIDLIARQHSEQLLEQAQRARLAAATRVPWRHTAARWALAAARAADPAVVERLPVQSPIAPARAH